MHASIGHLFQWHFLKSKEKFFNKHKKKKKGLRRGLKCTPIEKTKWTTVLWLHKLMNSYGLRRKMISLSFLSFRLLRFSPYFFCKSSDRNLEKRDSLQYPHSVTCFFYFLVFFLCFFDNVAALMYRQAVTNSKSLCQRF